jgi:hypothetical protein
MNSLDLVHDDDLGLLYQLGKEFFNNRDEVADGGNEFVRVLGISSN